MKNCMMSVFAACAAFAALADDAVKGGVHGYTTKGYVQPDEPEVLERLEWFKDQKLALMMHWGLKRAGTDPWSDDCCKCEMKV